MTIQITLFHTGDSLTSGTGATAGHDYPSVMAEIIARQPFVFSTANSGIPASTAAYWAAQDFIAPSVLTPYFHWSGINDVQAGATAAAIYANLKTVWRKGLESGYPVVAATIASAGTISAGQELVRLALNELIRSNRALFIQLADVAANPIFDSQVATANTTYYNVDTVHLTDLGYSIVAGIFAAASMSFALGDQPRRGEKKGSARSKRPS